MAWSTSNSSSIDVRGAITDGYAIITFTIEQIVIVLKNHEALKFDSCT